VHDSHPELDRDHRVDRKYHPTREEGETEGSSAVWMLYVPRSTLKKESCLIVEVKTAIFYNWMAFSSWSEIAQGQFESKRTIFILPTPRVL
jgi:hypothetical protein